VEVVRLPGMNRGILNIGLSVPTNIGILSDYFSFSSEKLRGIIAIV
jgi:hypothetical protein